jgi:hypothetical protein
MSSQVNGEVHSSSATLQHISSYPIINVALEHFKNNPYGKRSMIWGETAYQTFAKPVVPLISRPYQYVSPYIQKVDILGAGALSKVDEHLPMPKQLTVELYGNGKEIVCYSVAKGKETTTHVCSVYGSEYKEVGGEGIVAHGKALIATGLVITTETLEWIRDILRSGMSKAEEVGDKSP